MEVNWRCAVKSSMPAFCNVIILDITVWSLCVLNEQCFVLKFNYYTCRNITISAFITIHHHFSQHHFRPVTIIYQQWNADDSDLQMTVSFVSQIIYNVYSTNKLTAMQIRHLRYAALWPPSSAHCVCQQQFHDTANHSAKQTLQLQCAVCMGGCWPS